MCLRGRLERPNHPFLFSEKNKNKTSSLLHRQTSDLSVRFSRHFRLTCLVRNRCAPACQTPSTNGMLHRAGAQCLFAYHRPMGVRRTIALTTLELLGKYLRSAGCSNESQEGRRWVERARAEFRMGLQAEEERMIYSSAVVPGLQQRRHESTT